jgi:hypothetical protein
MQPTEIIKRINALLSLPPSGQAYGRASELVLATTSLMNVVYGDRNERTEVLKQQLGEIPPVVATWGKQEDYQSDVCEGALRSLKAELEGGLVGSLQMTLTGSVLADFLLLAKQAIEYGAINVAAVLVAAAFEDTIRRMGEILAGVTGRPDLGVVLGALKAKGILQAPLLGQVNAHLNFRNKALHADWSNIDKVSVETAWQLVQGLLLKHF